MNVIERMKFFNVPGLSFTYIKGGLTVSNTYGILEANTNKTVEDNSVFHACSISKMVTAMCVVRLAQAGKLDLYRDLGGGITLANLLAHQGGWCDEAGSIKFPPETVCQYSDLGYSHVARVVEEATGETIPQIAQRLVFDPLGLERTFFWDNIPKGVTLDECAVGHDKNGNIVPEIRKVYPNAEGAGLWSTPTELAKIAMNVESLLYQPYGCEEWMGLAVFLGENVFVSQGWGVGMQCKLRVDTKNQECIVVMINQDPGVDQDESIVGEIIKKYR